MIVHDFVGGRVFDVAYIPPVVPGDGRGSVYVLEDGFGIKVGYTNGPVAKRVAELQTGNPRRITVIAEIAGASVDVEDRLHRVLNEWNVSGEWFARGPIVSNAAGAGGFEPWLAGLLGDVVATIVVHPPYR